MSTPASIRVSSMGGLLLALASLLALPGCADDEAMIAFRELVGVWTLDARASLQQTVEGTLLDSSIDSEALDEITAHFDFKWTLEVTRSGVVELKDPRWARSLIGLMEDTGNTFRVRFEERLDGEFRLPDGTQGGRGVMTLELARVAEALHASIVGIDVEGRDTLAALKRLQNFATPRMVFRPLPIGLR